MTVTSLRKSALTAGIFLSSALAATALPVHAQDPRAPDPAYTAPLSPAEGETTFEFRLSGYVFGLKVVSAKYRGTIGEDSYSVYSDMKTSGLAAMLKKQKLWSYTDGIWSDDDILPVNHIQQNMNKKSRRVEVFYNYKRSRIRQTVNPRFGSMGHPPATPEQAFNSDDANSAMLKILMAGFRMDTEVCNETIPVYDGKQHYEMTISYHGTKEEKFDGKKYQALECHVYFEPISGFDPEDLPDADEKSKPVKVYLIPRPEYDLYMPVKFTYKVGGFSAKVKVKEATFKTR